MIFVCIDTFILQGCAANSLSVGSITVTCMSSHQIQVNASCTNCDDPAPPPKVKVGRNSVEIPDLEEGMMYTITINVYSNGRVVLMNDTVVFSNIVVMRKGENLCYSLKHKISL